MNKHNSMNASATVSCLLVEKYPNPLLLMKSWHSTYVHPFSFSCTFIVQTRLNDFVLSDSPQKEIRWRLPVYMFSWTDWVYINAKSSRRKRSAETGARAALIDGRLQSWRCMQLSSCPVSLVCKVCTTQYWCSKQTCKIFTWVQRGHMLGHPVIFEHVQQCCLARIVQAEEEQLATLLPQACKKINL